jgi:hypothetical protein
MKKILNETIFTCRGTTRGKDRYHPKNKVETKYQQIPETLAVLQASW